MFRRYIPVVLMLGALAAPAAEIPNPLIDYKAFEDLVVRAGEVRSLRRVTAEDFIRMAADPKTVVLDARSAEMFALMHIKGARNLSLPDFTEEELARLIPSKSTRVLIYCNNNFLNEPRAFPSKNLAVALNVHTFGALYAYGYTNVYELGPLLDINQATFPFEGKLVPR